MLRDDAGFTIEDAVTRATERIIIDPTTLFGRHLPDRQWIVQDWMPARTVTLNYADGGIGKTLLAQQLMTSCATAKPWLGLAVEPCRVFGIFCEDDADELHRRQDKINASLGVAFSNLGNMRWTSGVGSDNVLCRFDDGGTIQPTSRFLTLQDDVLRFGARLVIIDTAADTFGGNENDRLEVRQFINLLTKLAWQINGAVLINAHPSRDGLKSGNLDGGSTAWNNTCRSRWALARLPSNPDGDGDADTRVLSCRKANYAAIGTELKMRWQDGVLLPIAAQTGLAAMAATMDSEAVFLDLLTRFSGNGIRVSQSRHGSNFAPKLFGKAPDRGGFNAREFEGAMNRLLAANKVAVQDFGRPGRPERALIIPA